MKIIGTNILMTRGDSECITVSFRNSDGIIVPLSVGDTIYFTVKKNMNEEAKAFQKIITEFVNGNAEIIITPEDTKSLEFGSYVYDVQLKKSTGTVKTIVPPSQFMLGGEVTYE